MITDWRVIERELREQGWRVEPQGGRLRCVPPDRDRSIVMVQPDSGDWKAIRNTVRELRRSGYRPSWREDQEGPGLAAAAIAVGVEPRPHSEGLVPSLLAALARADGQVELGRSGGLDEVIGTHWRRRSRRDPRDPFTIVGRDDERGLAVLCDRHGAERRIPLREFRRLAGDLEQVSEEVRAAGPRVAGLPFGEALREMRHAHGLSQDELASMLGDDGLTGGAVGAWEAEACAPILRHYEQLLDLVPELRDAGRPNFVRPLIEKPAGRPPSEPGIPSHRATDVEDAPAPTPRAPLEREAVDELVAAAAAAEAAPPKAEDVGVRDLIQLLLELDPTAELAEVRRLTDPDRGVGYRVSVVAANRTVIVEGVGDTAQGAARACLGAIDRDLRVQEEELRARREALAAAVRGGGS